MEVTNVRVEPDCGGHPKDSVGQFSDIPLGCAATPRHRHVLKA